MEDLNLVEVGLAILAVVLPVGLGALYKFVKSTETKVDDKILDAVAKAFKDKESE